MMKKTDDDPSYTIKEAIQESRRCLHCPKPPCRDGCPIENDIPAFNRALSQGNIGEARDIIAERSNLPAICGRVCPHEKQCEGSCVLNKKGDPVKIGKIERFIADFDAEMQLTHPKLSVKNRGKVAVIGSGPAGLTVAGDLARIGFNVVVYESEAEPGGILLYGIPEFRLSKDVVRRETAYIEQMGVTYITNCMVGADITVDQMFERGFDAVFLGTGTALARFLELPGKELCGIIQSNYFLRMVRLFSDGDVKREEVPVETGDTVLVIGAGNVAMDAARSAIRMGAEKVTVVYRKTIEHMSASRAEYVGAVTDGVGFLWETVPLRYEGDGEKITGLTAECSAGELFLPADRILLAVGSRPAARIVSTTPGIETDLSGYVITKERPYGMTTRKGVFAGGDVVHKPATVVLAMKEAKKVAAGIAAYVDAKKLLEE